MPHLLDQASGGFLLRLQEHVLGNWRVPYEVA